MVEFQYSHFRSEWSLRAGVLIWQIVSPILIIFGTTGNVISIRVLSQRKFNRWSSTVYLIALSFADMCVLYIGLLRQWIKYTFGVDYRTLHPGLCKAHWWLMYSCSDIPVWILTVITIERLVATMCPYKSKRICTHNKAKIVLVIILFTALLINSHILYGFGALEIRKDNMTVYLPCAPATEYEHFFSKIWTWIDLCKFSLVPFAILSAGNACILTKIISSRRKVKARVQPVTSQGRVQQTTSSSDEKTSNMTILLVGLNFVFIVCTSPVCIYFIGESYWIPEDVPRDVQQQDPWWAFVNMLMFANHSTNFIMYCVTGSRFRQSVREMFICGARVNTVNSTNTAVTTTARSAAM